MSMDPATVKVAEWATLTLALDSMKKAQEAMETTAAMAVEAGHPKTAKEANDWVTHIKGMSAGLAEFLVSVRAVAHRRRRTEVTQAAIARARLAHEGVPDNGR